MREIKFRGKAMLTAERMEELEIPHENGWVCGYLIDNYMTGKVVDADVGFIALEWRAKVIPETVGQFTGLLDKNGREIYEGDIVKAWSQGICGKFKVIWRQEGSPCWILYPAWLNGGFWHLHGTRHEQGYWYDNVEVIGNVHDNPEFLQEVSG